MAACHTCGYDGCAGVLHPSCCAYAASPAGSSVVWVDLAGQEKLAARVRAAALREAADICESGTPEWSPSGVDSAEAAAVLRALAAETDEAYQ